MTHVFLIHDASGEVPVRTPEIRTCAAASGVRHVLMREASGAGRRIEACVLTLGDLLVSGEIGLITARVGRWPVRALPGRDQVPGPLTSRRHARLQRLFEARADG